MKTATLVAKPIVKNQYWVITDSTGKVGNVVATASGYELKMHGSTSYFDSTSTIQKQTHIVFQSAPSKKREIVFSHFPTPVKVFNSVFDIKRKLHLFNKTSKSKCFYAAGWFTVKQGQLITTEFCPKYIFIQRYEYAGPYKTKQEADNAINTL